MLLAEASSKRSTNRGISQKTNFYQFFYNMLDIYYQIYQ